MVWAAGYDVLTMVLVGVVGKIFQSLFGGSKLNPRKVWKAGQTSLATLAIRMRADSLRELKRDVLRRFEQEAAG